MSGHSKWANIKHKKAAADQKKGKVFSKVASEITVCVRQSGADVGSNITLRTLLQKARAANMPADTIDRAIKKGTGELQGAVLEEIMFEGYASGGVAIIVHGLTDNRNRTVAEVRHTFNKFDHNLAGQGQVLRTFQRKGYILIAQSVIEEDKLMELVLDAGADDMKLEEGQYEITMDPSQFNAVVEALGNANVETVSAEITLLPDTWTTVQNKSKASSLLRFIEELEDLEDVQNVYSNADIDEKIMQELSEE